MGCSEEMGQEMGGPRPGGTGRLEQEGRDRITCRMRAWEETKGFSREDKGLGYSGGLGASKGL